MWEKSPENSNEPLLVLAENFLCDPEKFVTEAINMRPEQWPAAGIHDDSQYDGKDPVERKLRGNGCSACPLLPCTAPTLLLWCAGSLGCAAM